MTYWCIYYTIYNYVQHTLCQQYAYIIFKFPTKFQLIKYQHFSLHVPIKWFIFLIENHKPLKISLPLAIVMIRFVMYNY